MNVKGGVGGFGEWGKVRFVWTDNTREQYEERMRGGRLCADSVEQRGHVVLLIQHD